MVKGSNGFSSTAPTYKSLIKISGLEQNVFNMPFRVKG